VDVIIDGAAAAQGEAVDAKDMGQQLSKLVVVAILQVGIGLWRGNSQRYRVLLDLPVGVSKHELRAGADRLMDKVSDIQWCRHTLVLCVAGDCVIAHIVGECWFWTLLIRKLTTLGSS
jgi:hypothetical protein